MLLESDCKLIPCSIVMKIRGSDKSYQDAMEASAKFNKRLSEERKMRIPFIDSQTRVAQANSLMWNMSYQRIKLNNKNGCVYAYPVKKWYKHRRLLLENDNPILQRPLIPMTLSEPLIINEPIMEPPPSNSHHNHNNNNHYHHHQNQNHSSNSSVGHHHNQQQQQHHHHQHHHHHHHHHHQNLQKQISNPNDDFDHFKHNTPSSSNNNAALHANEDWHIMHHDDSLENADTNDNENNESDDDFDDGKRKKGSKKSIKKGKRTKAEIPNEDKPYVCDKCGVKYKTKPGLSYHIQKAHNSHSSTSQIGKTHELINADDNTNSVFESVYDDMNSSSSLPQTALSSHANQKINFSSSLSLNNTASQSSVNNNNICQQSINNNAQTNNQSKNDKCGICFVADFEKPNQSETISCFECNKSFHTSCLKFTSNMILSVKKYNWQCIECKRCTLCGNSENDDKLLFCDDCDRGYHMYCLNPPLKEAPEGDWRCDLCVKLFGVQV